MRNKLLLYSIMLGGGVTFVYADDRFDYVWVTNSLGSNGDGDQDDVEQGNAKDLRAYLPELGYQGLGTYPCLDGITEVHLSEYGQSWGLARNRTFSVAENYLYASISGDRWKEGCVTAECSGVMRIVATGSTDGPYWSSGGYPGAVTDVAGNDDDVFILVKGNTGNIPQLDLTSGTDVNDYTDLSTTALSHLTQIEWLDTEYFVATDAGHLRSANECNSSSVSENGYLCLGKLNDTSFYCIDTAALPSGTKPEGIAIEQIDSSFSTSCDASADWVIYVTDFCQSDLYVYTVDLDTETFIYETVISLDTDSSDTGSSIGGYCNPSNIEARFHSSANNLFALCQTRSSVMKIRVTGTGVDQCNPGWTSGNDELLLEKFSSGTFSCTSSGTTVACGTSDCQPHDISIPYYMWPNWLFVTLSTSGDIVAVKDDFSEQHLLYHKTSTLLHPWVPLEIELLPSCSPTDPNCEYPP